MKININVEYMQEIEENQIYMNIKANRSTEVLDKLIKNIQDLSKNTDTIVAEIDNNIYILDTDDIVKFYSENQYTYCVYHNKIYKVKKKLYELEELLRKENFIRISKSCIINIRQVECFDMKNIGSIIVKFKNKDVEYVSKRKISEVIKFLKERWD